MITAGLGYGYCAIRDRQTLQDFFGNVAVGCATLPGLPTQRSCLVMYAHEHPNKALLEELWTLLQEIENGKYDFLIH